MDKFDSLVETFQRKTGVASTKLGDRFFQEANESLAEAERVLRLIEEELRLMDKLLRRSRRSTVSKLKKDLKSLRLKYSQTDAVELLESEWKSFDGKDHELLGTKPVTDQEDDADDEEEPPCRPTQRSRQPLLDDGQILFSPCRGLR